MADNKPEQKEKEVNNEAIQALKGFKSADALEEYNKNEQKKKDEYARKQALEEQQNWKHFAMNIQNKYAHKPST